jgi:hypothetical protein
MKLTHLTSTALLALVTTIGLQAGSTNDMKDMKQVSPAMNPSDAGFYVGAYGGVNFSSNYGDRTTSINGPGGSDVTPDHVHTGVGAVGGIKAGYNFESFPVCSSFRLQPAVEVEGLYIGMDSKAQGGGGAASYHDSTSWNNAAGFVNGILRFKISDQGFWSKFVPHWALFTEYKFIDALGADMKSNIGGGNQYDFHPDQIQQNLATVGVKYNF